MKPTLTLPPGAQSALAQLRRRWTALAPRERAGVALSGALVLVLLLWSIGLQPALRTLREAPGQRAALDADLARMQRLAAEAAELRAQPPVDPSQADAALQSATAQLGDGAKLQRSGERVTVTLTGVEPGALLNWLGEVRNAARGRVIEAQLTRAGHGYSGSVVLALAGAGR